MAERRVIDEYVAVVGRTLGGLRRAPDLIAEVEDHLLLSAADETAAGIDPATAQTQALQQLGDPQLLAVSLATGSGAGLALPSRLSRVAGKAAAIGGVGWISTAVLLKIWKSNPPAPTGHMWFVNDVVGLAAYIGSLVALWGMFARSGASRAPSSVLALIGTAVGMLNLMVPWGRGVSPLLTVLLICASAVVGLRWFRTLRGGVWPLLLLPVGPSTELVALLVYRFGTRSVGPGQPAFVLFEIGMVAFGVSVWGCAFLLRRNNYEVVDSVHRIVTS